MSARLTFLRIWAIAAIVMGGLALIVFGSVGVDDLAGADADAIIVAVTSGHPRRHVFDATFVTAAGVACRSTLDTGSSTSDLAPIHVDDHVRVHYGRWRPCGNVRPAADGWVPGFELVGPVVFVTLGIGLLYLDRRHPEKLERWTARRHHWRRRRLP